jgi:hypothetical protein
MHAYLDQYPLAPASRVEDALRFFPYRTTTAEEYAAREGPFWVCFSFGSYIYEDPVLNEWIHTLDDILFEPGRLEQLQRKFMSEAEIAELRRKAAEPW